MKKIVLLQLLVLLSLPCVAQTKHLLRGTVIDSDTREPVAGAAVYSKADQGSAVTTDELGRFSLSLASGNHVVVFLLLGYQPLETEVAMCAPKEMQFLLKPGTLDIDAITVSSVSPAERIANVQIGMERVEIAEMAKIPSLFGERDIVRSLQLLPGVKAESDASSGFQVRGGTSSQNLILLDDATVYNAGHLMGIFSTFNDDALTSVSLYKGQIPARFGGAVSSVLDVHTKSGNMQDYKLSGSLGLLSAKLNLEGPIVRDKISFFAAARRTYFDVFLKLTRDYKGTTLNFFDLNAKVDFNISDRDKLFVSFFSGHDNMGLDDMMDMRWGNNTATVRWFHRSGSKLHSNASVVLSSYGSDNGADILETTYRFDGFIKQAGFKEALTWRPGDSHEVDFGFQTLYFSLKSAEWDMNNYRQKEQRNAWENTLWINEHWKVSERLGVSAGLRLNAFSALGGAPYYGLDQNGDIARTMHYGSTEIVKTHLTLEPRFSANFRIDDRQSIKAGYSRTSQNIHALRSNTMSLPFDRYTMSSNIVEPQLSDQLSLGYMALTRDGKYDFSVEGYYKKMDNVPDYKDGKSFNSEIEIERLILSGQGRACGVEFHARKNIGNLTGWVAYTLSWSQNRIPGINNGHWYTAGNDRRHDLSIVGMYALPGGWHVAGTWVYNTGQALTAPSAKYEVDGETVYYYAERNGYRAPHYHRLDISATHTKKKKNFTREWSFGLYNAYCRYNPFIISFETDDDRPSGIRTVQTSLFGVIPFISYNFRF